ncbi:MAG: DUF2797 domain-containing protein [Bdellovibrionales bacterium]|nr:DUF2797 domain-containing protein [Bdellovibrionales bacterium]
MNQVSIILEKMGHSGPSLDALNPVKYTLGELDLSAHVGKFIRLEFTGECNCIHCGRPIKKTFQQGYCFPCFQTLAQCDSCILKPETCHFRHGTCREPEWAKGHCLIEHVVYLANTTGLKIGITRRGQELTRWGDQGALQAVVLAIVPERYVAGLLEVDMKGQVPDKTSWQKLLKGEFQKVDLLSERERVRGLVSPRYQEFLVQDSSFDRVFEFHYPVEQYLSKAKTHNFDKDRIIEGTLSGIHGQYLFIGDAALNVRKFGGYKIVLSF